MSDAKKTILVVDDELTIRTSLSLLLGESGYSVTTAEDGFSALASLREDIPEFLISDLYMPGMTGFELTSVVRRRFPEVRTIAMSGAYRGDEVPSGIAADAFFQKGSRVTDLLGILEAMTLETGRIPARERRVAVSIWIQPDKYGKNGVVHITVCCPECLRAFDEEASDFRGGVHETVCTHCRIRLHYALVPSLDGAASRASQRARTTGMQMLADRPQFDH
ncbi:MAG: response regulator [Terracidiphilus sp.]|jgi:CheY-like chemotaxis protein